MTFAEFIKIAMEQTGLSKYMLAKKLGVVQTTVANWEKGKTEPHDKKRETVFDFFGVTEDDLNSDTILVTCKKEKPVVTENNGPKEETKEDILKDLESLIQILTPAELTDVLSYTKYVVSKREQQ